MEDLNDRDHRERVVTAYLEGYLRRPFGGTKDVTPGTLRARALGFSDQDRGGTPRSADDVLDHVEAELLAIDAWGKLPGVEEPKPAVAGLTDYAAELRGIDARNAREAAPTGTWHEIDGLPGRWLKVAAGVYRREADGKEARFCAGTSAPWTLRDGTDPEALAKVIRAAVADMFLEPDAPVDPDKLCAGCRVSLEDERQRLAEVRSEQRAAALRARGEKMAALADARRSERGAIAAWVRDRGEELFADGFHAFADRVERGDHNLPWSGGVRGTPLPTETAPHVAPGVDTRDSAPAHGISTNAALSRVLQAWLDWAGAAAVNGGFTTHETLLDNLGRALRGAGLVVDSDVTEKGRALLAARST